MVETENQAKNAPRTLSEWLTLLFETYDRKPSEWQLLSYATALANLDERELRLAFIGAVRRNASGFVPSPGQILEALELEREKLPAGARPNPDSECPDCGGAGWKVITHEVTVARARDGQETKEPRSFAVRCDHRGGHSKNPCPDGHASH